MSAWALRAAGAEDAEFLYRVYASTRLEEMAAIGWDATDQEVFLRMQFKAQDRHLRQQYPRARFDIIELDGLPIGRLYMDRDETLIYGIDFAILPEYRGQGLGCKVMESLLAECRATGRPMQMRVARDIPATRLYRRLGFEQVADEGPYRLMQWIATCAGASRESIESADAVAA